MQWGLGHREITQTVSRPTANMRLDYRLTHALTKKAIIFSTGFLGVFVDILVARQNTSQKQLKEERAYFGSQIVGAVCRGGEGSRNSGQPVPGRKQRDE